MNIWIITDTHFGHVKMLEYCGRPQGFEDLILRNIHLKVMPGDLLIHLGDFAMGKSPTEDEWIQRYMEQTKGVKKILVTGNHDNHTATWYMERGFDLACRSFTGKYFGFNLLFSHIPRDVRVYPAIDYNIHGHFHNSDHRSSEPEIQAFYSDRNIKLAIEETEYKPVSLEALLKGKTKKNEPKKKETP